MTHDDICSNCEIDRPCGGFISHERFIKLKNWMSEHLPKAKTLNSDGLFDVGEGYISENCKYRLEHVVAVEEHEKP